MALTPYLSKRHSRFLDKLTAGLADPCSSGGESSRVYDNTDGVYMPLHVERIGKHRVSVAHYFTQNGDRVPDPDIEFVRAPCGRWMPAAATMAVGTYRRAVETDDNGVPVSYAPRAMRAIKPLARLLLDNAKRQQGL